MLVQTKNIYYLHVEEKKKVVFKPLTCVTDSWINQNIGIFQRILIEVSEPKIVKIIIHDCNLMFELNH